MHSIVCLFVLSMVFFAVQKLLSVIRSHLFILLLFPLLYKTDKKLLQFITKTVMFMLSSRSFMASTLIFRSLMHFQFIFVYGVR